MIALQLLCVGPVGLLPLHDESERIWYLNGVIFRRQCICRLCSPLPQVLEHGLQPDWYHLTRTQHILSTVYGPFYFEGRMGGEEGQLQKQIPVQEK